MTGEIASKVKKEKQRNTWQLNMTIGVGRSQNLSLAVTWRGQRCEEPLQL